MPFASENRLPLIDAEIREVALGKFFVPQVTTHRDARRVRSQSHGPRDRVQFPRGPGDGQLRC